LSSGHAYNERILIINNCHVYVNIA
jgi:hypothetical protein